MGLKNWSLCFAFLLCTVVLTGNTSAVDSSPDQALHSTIENTSAFIEKGMQEYNIVGLSIALVHGDSIVWSEGFGYADRENKIPATAETVYMLGSISKTLTAVSVLQLLDQGKIADLNDPLGDYLPGFEMRKRYPEQYQEMTIRRVLNHHSGIPGDIYNSGFVSRKWEDWQPGLYSSWLLSYLKNDYPSHRPGQVASYSNTGFALAGEVARIQAGEESFAEHMQNSLFQPLQMKSSSFRQIHKGAAKGYFQGEAIIPDCEVNMAPTGGAYTTVKDMARFIKMLLNEGKYPGGERILEPETVDLMGQMEKTPLDVDSYMQPGLGLDSADDPLMRYAGRAWTKDGGTKNFKSFMEILPDKDLGVIVLTNSDTASRFKYAVARECLQNALLERFGLEPVRPELPEYRSLTKQQEIEGMYVHSGGFDRITARGAKKLTWTKDAQSQEPQKFELQYNQQSRMYDVDGKEYSIVFLNRSWQGKSYILMLKYGATSGSAAFVAGDRSVVCLGQKTEKVDIPRAWQNRTGKKYIIENIGWNDVYLWNYAFFQLHEQDGILMLTGMLDQPIFPENEELAFLRGLMGQRSDSSVRVIQEDGREKLLTAGFKAYDAELVSQVQIGESVSGKSKPLHNTWFKLHLDSDPGRLSLDTGNEDYTLRVMDSDLVQQVAWDRGALSWEAEAGTWYIAVCPSPNAPQDFKLKVSAL
jgi:CubicO group peptidase (beta-lactamase class C family)